jgi:hypothetical protein
MDESYVEEQKQLLADFAREFLERTRDLGPQDGLRELALAFGELSAGDGDLYAEGPPLVSRLFTVYPEFAPTFPRALLWFLGAECLHFMPDEEIAEFERQLEEDKA